MSLRIVSYNIQAAIGTKAYRQYLTQIRKQVFHAKSKTNTLKAIAGFISDYDVACLQEVDLGGRRSGFKCQVDHLLSHSNLSYMSAQENRIVGNISRHGNAILSKYPQTDIRDLKLPGSRAGRGAIIARVEASKPFYILNVHLSLGEADQLKQIKYIAQQAPSDAPLIIAGDFNCSAVSRPLLGMSSGMNMTLLTSPNDKTYPSWNPRKGFDHILVSPHFSAKDSGVSDIRHSDHRPVEAELMH